MEELEELGASGLKKTLAGLACIADLETAYRICLWSRIAGRVLLQVGQFEAHSMDDVYTEAKKIEWDLHFDADAAISIQANLIGSELKNENFAALKVKDGVVDFFRERVGRRPSVDTVAPDIRLNLHVKNGNASLYIDISGESLSKRAYRLEATDAPLRENSAAAMVMKAGWPSIARGGGFFLDPMCGSGTLVIEAALIAADIAPGILRGEFGFSRWKGHDQEIWNRVRKDAEQRREEGVKGLPPMYAADIDEAAVNVCRKNLERAGLAEFVRLDTGDFRSLDCTGIPIHRGGLVAANPPYGVRLEDRRKVPSLYRDLGKWAKETFPESILALLAPDREIAKHVGLRADRVNTFYNGNLKILLATFRLSDNNVFSEYDPDRIKVRINDDETTGVNMIIHRIRKNRKALKKYLKASGTSCYRIYDADIPQYSAAVDVYEERDLVIQEYAPPKTVDREKAAGRLQELVAAFAHEFSLDRKHLHLKQRRKQKGAEQYHRREGEGTVSIVGENGLRFFVNFTDYLDTGLFLDHRTTREMVRDLAEGKNVLNLFAYTCTASVYAAAGGASSTVSVDTSRTYLEWGRKNMELNSFSSDTNRMVRMDSIEFLKTDQNRYGLIFVDPPTFSNRKGAVDVFDVQRDHSALIGHAVRRLAPGGVILFSNNFRRFKLDPELEERYRVEEISAQTIPPDFQRNPRIHRTWMIREQSDNTRWNG